MFTIVSSERLLPAAVHAETPDAAAHVLIGAGIFREYFTGAAGRGGVSQCFIFVSSFLDEGEDPNRGVCCCGSLPKKMRVYTIFLSISLIVYAVVFVLLWIILVRAVKQHRADETQATLVLIVGVLLTLLSVGALVARLVVREPETVSFLTTRLVLLGISAIVAWSIFIRQKTIRPTKLALWAVVLENICVLSAFVTADALLRQK